MPTGYTSKLYEGEQSFKDFIMGGAHAVMGEHIPETYEPSNYYIDKLKESLIKLEEFVSMNSNSAEMYQAIRDEYDEKINDYRRYRANILSIYDRYTEMLKKVDAWQPKYTELCELKKFMHDQLISAIDFDCESHFKYGSPEPQFLALEEWRVKKFKDLKRDVEYYTKECIKEQERADNNNKWMYALKKSLEESGEDV